MYQLQEGKKKDNIINPKLKIDDNWTTAEK